MDEIYGTYKDKLFRITIGIGVEGCRRRGKSRKMWGENISNIVKKEKIQWVTQKDYQKTGKYFEN